VSAGAARTNTQPISTKPSMPLQHGPQGSRGCNPHSPILEGR
jgi:hypothetical protein